MSIPALTFPLVVFASNRFLGDKQRAATTSTTTHKVKLALTTSMSAACLFSVIWLTAFADAPSLSALIVNALNSVAWAGAAVLIRREFLKTSETSKFLRGWFIVAFSCLCALVPLLMAVDPTLSTLYDIRVEAIVMLILSASTMLVSLMWPKDYPHESYHELNMDFVYEPKLESKKSEEEVWRQFDEVHKADVYKSRELETEQRLLKAMEKLREVDVYDYELADVKDDIVVLYAITCRRGRSGSLRSTTYRSYSEFKQFHAEMQRRRPDLALPALPAPLPRDVSLTEEAIQVRVDGFQRLMKYLLAHEVEDEEVNEFLAVNVTLPVLIAKPRSRSNATFSTDCESLSEDSLLDVARQNAEMKVDAAPSEQAKQAERQVPTVVPKTVPVQEKPKPAPVQEKPKPAPVQEKPKPVKEMPKEMDEVRVEESKQPEEPRPVQTRPKSVSLPVVTPDIIRPVVPAEPQLQIAVMSAFETGSGSTKHTMYVVASTLGPESLVCARRFKEFQNLHDRLKKKYSNLPAFPSASMGQSSTDPKVVATRKERLQSYLTALVETQGLSKDTSLLEFLNIVRK